MAYVRKTIYHKDKFGPLYGTGTRHYCIWAGMKKRGIGKDKTNSHKYSDRGITICNEWMDYSNFAEWSVSNGYSDDLSIDRIDNNGNYCPENCRWATSLEQAQNKRNVLLYEYNGQKLSAPEWARKYGIKKSTLKERIRLRGMSISEAINYGGISSH
jgi:hypothetical protein